MAELIAVGGAEVGGGTPEEVEDMDTEVGVTVGALLPIEEPVEDGVGVVEVMELVTETGGLVAED